MGESVPRGCQSEWNYGRRMPACAPWDLREAAEVQTRKQYASWPANHSVGPGEGEEKEKGQWAELLDR